MVDVTVAIPTYRNNGETIGKTLEALARQTYRDFSVLIVYKFYEGDKTLDVVEKYGKHLDVKIIEQKHGYFEEALNIIYSNAKSDILILTHDDTVPSKTFVEEHVRLHLEYPDIGVIGGFVEPIHDLKHERVKSLSKIVYKIIRYSSPLIESMNMYSSYPNILGFLYYNEPPFRKGEVRYTFWIEGVNMSVKRKIYRDFALPCSTVYGTGNEILLSLYSLKKGYHVLRAYCCEVKHLGRESLSGSSDAVKMYKWHIDGAVLPYNVNYITGRVNRTWLKRYIVYTRYLWKIKCVLNKMPGPLIYSHTRVLPFIIEAIGKKVEPVKIREKIIGIIRELDECAENNDLIQCICNEETIEK